MAAREKQEQGRTLAHLAGEAGEPERRLKKLSEAIGDLQRRQLVLEATVRDLQSASHSHDHQDLFWGVSDQRPEGARRRRRLWASALLALALGAILAVFTAYFGIGTNLRGLQDLPPFVLEEVIALVNWVNLALGTGVALIAAGLMILMRLRTYRRSESDQQTG